ncbi:hypothetical protein GLAREA_12363 [Glarea lozoyensis ATCC 20868]|uniref:TPR-like protein n=1 Tax=Glarea lozoyensis (strain ATCC 20868 / MF5171) TaxID=1116229 RepID=S3CZB0_GLAL2|nr:uncharacterized protein GLAREA_12363 [Glarea lozoyensis ATCC 20868]EPE31607.1 hypothetical protein GLAREA_12363 [Glarea lozoyensis ATCC 20868]
MTKKKSPKVEDGNGTGPSSTASSASTSKPKIAKPPQAQPSTSALIICRNKHWRYISSFHGPWLQLPPEVLESLANNNYNHPRPRPIDPAVFFDLFKIRQLVDDATNLSVRASNGVTSSTLTNSLNAGNGLLGNGGAALGIGIGGGGGNAKLSRERKHKMREQATQKLSKAYHLDEIACSVATMQSASTLEDVAHLVLQRNPEDADAKYVHFFHEKIPSRQLAECTSLEPLNQLVRDRPREGELLRTRAVTRIFKEEYVEAVEDFKEALRVCKSVQDQHGAGRQQLQLASELAAEKNNGRWKEEFKLAEEDHPSSLKTQLLFQRAGVHLTIACQHVEAALPPKSAANRLNGKNKASDPATNGTPSEPSELTHADLEILRKRQEARKKVKTHAKRALQDYLRYLEQFEYTPGLPAEVAEEFLRKFGHAANGFKSSKSSNEYKNRNLDLETNNSLSNGQLSDALVPHKGSNRNRPQSSSRPTDINFPPPKVHPISTLFSPTPPTDLPPYPNSSLTTSQAQNYQFSQESLTYHPLLPEALHSLLLTHCLLQTSPRELSRHAYMAARLLRLSTGSPIFQPARSPSRADWIEVLKHISSTISLSSTWEHLCASAPLPGETRETGEERKERLRQQAVMEALEDERVCDEKSFREAVRAREGRLEGKKMNDGFEVLTERAAVVVRWVREAEVGGAGRKKRKGKGVVKGMEGLSVKDEGLERVVEEVD